MFDFSTTLDFALCATWLALLTHPLCVVMLHEMAHALVALALGSGVKEFHVGPTGGHVQHQYPIRSEDMFAIAAAGPASNLGIAYVCLQVPGMWPVAVFHAYMLACAFYPDGDYHLMREAARSPSATWM